MKCNITKHFINVYTGWSSEKKIHHGNYNLLPLDTYIETTRKKKIQRANGAMNTHMHARMTPASGWADGLG